MITETVQYALYGILLAYWLSYSRDPPQQSPQEQLPLQEQLDQLQQQQKEQEQQQEQQHGQAGRLQLASGPSSSSPYIKGQRNKVYMDEGSLLFDRPEHSFAIVSDLDRESRDPQRFVWRSYLRLATLRRRGSRYEIRWGEELQLQTNTAKHNRSLELSELVMFERRLLAMCDYTGLIFKISSPDVAAKNPKPRVFQRWAIADGNGDSIKPCKMEWATVKDGVLWVGSVGKEWTTRTGEIDLDDRGSEWVKAIEDSGRVRNVNWGPVYAALRQATNTSLSTGGWLWHEAVHWDPRTRRWIFLPRKESHSTPFIPGATSELGSNLLLIVSEGFTSIDVRRVGPLELDRGFTAVRKVPGTEQDFVALKVKETKGEVKSWITVFDLDGNLLLDPNPFEFVGDLKFEGLEFLRDS